ncbi:MAG: hypothetical protein NVS4B2_27450 [Chloroflexota bacterium]
MAADVKGFMHRHPDLKGFFDKFMKDNVGFLASAVAWAVLTSIVPIIVGLLAISGLILRGNPSAQSEVVSNVSKAIQGVLTRQDIQHLVDVSIQHTGLLSVIGLLGIFWGGSNVGGAISTVFQPIFEVKGRDFLKEKLIDVGMIFVFAILMIVIIVGTTAGTLLGSLFSTVPLPSGTAQFVIGTAVALVSAFLLFATIYLVFPNVDPALKIRNVWPGAVIAAVLFEILTFIFPLYTRFAHFNKYSALIGSLLLLTAWIYFFAMVTLVGAEFVSYRALKVARDEHRSIGPAPDDTVPQRQGVMGEQARQDEQRARESDESRRAAS